MSRKVNLPHPRRGARLPPSSVHFNGSVNLPDAETVMREMRDRTLASGEVLDVTLGGAQQRGVGAGVLVVHCPKLVRPPDL